MQCLIFIFICFTIERTRSGTISFLSSSSIETLTTMKLPGRTDQMETPSYPSVYRDRIVFLYIVIVVIIIVSTLSECYKRYARRWKANRTPNSSLIFMVMQSVHRWCHIFVLKCICVLFNWNSAGEEVVKSFNKSMNKNGDDAWLVVSWRGREFKKRMKIFHARCVFSVAKQSTSIQGS